MGTIKAMFNPKDFKAMFDAKAFDRDMKVAERLYEVCRGIAQEAKDSHEYDNIKGQLESSIGVVVLIDRGTVYKWQSLAASGRSPEMGIADINRIISSSIAGKSSLPNGISIPAKGVVGIVFAAAPYAGLVEDRNRKVLFDFIPAGNYIFKQIAMI